MSKKIIYYGVRELILTDTISTDLGEAFNAVHEYTSPNDLKLFLNRFLENDTLMKGFIFGQSLDDLLDAVKHQFKYIEAAGGVVSNPLREILFIFRRGKWDLPKGKCEKGETTEETALREVEEECGLQDLSLIKPLTSTFHIYRERNQSILKNTYWYAMSAPKQIGVPQLEEDIISLKWLKKNDLDNVHANTYPSILRVLESI